MANKKKTYSKKKVPQKKAVKRKSKYKPRAKHYPIPIKPKTKSEMAFQLAKLTTKPQVIEFTYTKFLGSSVGKAVMASLGSDAQAYTGFANPDIPFEFGLNPYCLTIAQSTYSNVQEESILGARNHSLTICNQQANEVDVTVHWVLPRHDYYSSHTVHNTFSDLNDLIGQTLNLEDSFSTAANCLKAVPIDVNLFKMNRILHFYKIKKTDHFTLQPGQCRKFQDLIKQPLNLDGEFYANAPYITGYAHRTLTPIVIAKGAIVHSAGTSDSLMAAISTSQVKLEVVYKAIYELYKVSTAKTTIVHYGGMDPVTNPTSMQMSNPSNVNTYT